MSCGEMAIIGGEMCECMREKGHPGFHIDLNTLTSWGSITPKDAARIYAAVARSMMREREKEKEAMDEEEEPVSEEGREAILRMLGSGVKASDVRFTVRRHGGHKDVVASVPSHVDAVIYCPVEKAVVGAL